MVTKQPHRFNKGDKVIAKNYIGVEYRRIFSHYGEHGQPFCFYYGADEWACEGRVTAYLDVRKPTINELRK